MGYTFVTEPRPDDWDTLVELPNPPHIALQHLRGVSDEMNPTALNRPASFVEEKIGTLIKTFQRTISDEVGNAGPEHCRTKKALVLSMRTIQSLLRDPPSVLSTVDLRCFAQDRFRAVRQELEQQHIRSRLAVRMLEDMVRYSVITVHEMCQASDYSAPLGIDKNEISKMLKSLQQMYQEHRQAGDTVATESEFTSYAILLKAGQDLGNSLSLSLAAALVSTHDDVLNDSCVKWSLEIARYARERNPARFFRLCEDATYVQACFVHMQFLEAVRQAQASMLFQRKNSLAVAELREHLLLDSDEDVISWFTTYKLPFENDNGKLMLDKLPPLAGRGPGADVSHRFLQKARGQSLGDMISSKLAWPFAGQAPRPDACSKRAVRHFGDPAFGNTAALGIRAAQNRDIFSSAQVTVPLTGFTVAKVAGNSGQQGAIPAAAGVFPPSPGHAERPAAARLHAAEAAASQAAAAAAEQCADAERAAAVKAAAEQAEAERAAAVETAKAEATKRLRQEQEAMAIAAKEFAQKRAEAEAIFAAERMAKMKLDAEYVRAGETLTRKERDAWAQAEEQYRAQLAEAAAQRVEVERLKLERAATQAEAAAQKQRAEHTAWYQQISEAQGLLRPQLEEECLQALRQREEYRNVKECVLQSLLLMKAMGGGQGSAPGDSRVDATAADAQGAGNTLAPGDGEVAVHTTRALRWCSGAMPADSSPIDTAGSRLAATAPTLHEHGAVMTARICARSRTTVALSTSAYISKLTNTRRFKSVQDRPRR